MFQYLSMTGTGILVVIITEVLGKFGIVADQGSITSLVKDLIEIGGIVMTIWGQARRPDLVAGIFRK